MKNQKGFTLIELLIVISIIGILTTLVTVNLMGLQMRGRDSTRKSNLESIRTALEKYYDDNNSYPTHSTFPTILTSGATVYIKNMPTDPKTGNNYIFCAATAVGTNILKYKLLALLENTNDNSVCSTSACGSMTGYTCTSTVNSSTVNYMVEQP